ncbi:riboflavin kinase [Candidatus Woesebacteria bacterium]|nr:riboflavin kinase [Candidatus Woesebacteria bacterium]
MKKYNFRAKVIEGEKLGRKLGFPTANMDPSIFDHSLQKGVYSAEVRYEISRENKESNANNPENKTLDGNNLLFSKPYLGVLFYGPKTVGQVLQNSLEVHILDFNEDIYGKIIEVKLLKFIREPIAFASLDALVDQIKQDILDAKKSI